MIPLLFRSATNLDVSILLLASRYLLDILILTETMFSYREGFRHVSGKYPCSWARVL